MTGRLAPKVEGGGAIFYYLTTRWPQKLIERRAANKPMRTLCTILCLFLLWSCGPSKPSVPRPDPEGFERDLAAIKRHGTLRVITNYSATSYFLYRGQPMGFEYELLQRFADHLDVDLEIEVAQNIDSLIHKLKAGDVDLVAFGLAITQDRKQEVAFSDYLYLTHQVLVQRKPEGWRRMSWSRVQKELIDDAIELIDDTVSVRINSSYFKRLQHLSEEVGGDIYIDTLPGNLSTDKIIKMVVDGEIKYTVADNNIARINASYYPSLNVEVPVSFSQRIAWATRFDSPELLSALNEWIKDMKDQTDYYVIYNKYFKNRRDFRKRVESDFYSLSNNAISPYDELIRKNAERIGWDWRLLAALVYQESRFETNVFSWAEASGLMQLMPETAAELNVEDPTDPAQNLRGGTKYLQQLWGNFEAVSDSIQRLKFAMAAFNCGMGHVLDAQRLAESRQLDRLTWDDNVADMVLALSYPEGYNDPVVKYGYVRGLEPYTYVEQIFERYEHYCQFIEREPATAVSEGNRQK